jgi:hypothetical protein
MSKTQTGTNIRNIYRVRTGWYLQLQWSGRVFRELFSDSTYGGQSGSLDKAIRVRDWHNKFRADFETCVAALVAANKRDDHRAYQRALAVLSKAVRAGCSTRIDRDLYNEYFSLEPGYVKA